MVIPKRIFVETESKLTARDFLHWGKCMVPLTMESKTWLGMACITSLKSETEVKYVLL